MSSPAQSFIARNNPGVLLFPDVAALGATPRGQKVEPGPHLHPTCTPPITATPTPLQTQPDPNTTGRLLPRPHAPSGGDHARATYHVPQATTAYGGEAAVPYANLIVAGTSCKDFSNLKGRDRKGIEAMGTSGETFIGFVNLLFEQRYPLAVLENLATAEWEKMRHYITGRLPLDSIKPNKNKKADMPTELRFEVDKKKGCFIVSEVCEFAGVRLGAHLLGYQLLDAKSARPAAAMEAVDAKSYSGTSVGLTRMRAAYGFDDHDQYQLIFETPAQYETELSALDAKEFGVPQTRQRKYMLIWQRDHFAEGTDVAGLWTNLVNFLRCPLKCGVDPLMPPPSHPPRIPLASPSHALTSPSPHPHLTLTHSNTPAHTLAHPRTPSHTLTHTHTHRS